MSAVRKNYTLSPATLQQLAELSKWWGNLEPLNASRTIAEALNRAHSVESRRQKIQKGTNHETPESR